MTWKSVLYGHSLPPCTWKSIKTGYWKIAWIVATSLAYPLQHIMHEATMLWYLSFCFNFKFIRVTLVVHRIHLKLWIYNSICLRNLGRFSESLKYKPVRSNTLNSHLPYFFLHAYRRSSDAVNRAAKVRAAIKTGTCIAIRNYLKTLAASLRLARVTS